MLLDRREEARPSRSRIELGLGAEQRLAAAHAAVEAVIPGVPVRTGEGAFGAVLARHVILLRRQLAAPFGIRLLDPDLGIAGHSGVSVARANIGAAPLPLK